MGDFGLMFYNARMYDPALGRFTSADTIIPPGLQGLDRYAYVNNAPVMYVDPSGHSVDCSIGDPYCTAGEYKPSALIKLYKERDGGPIYGYSALTEEIESYLQRHPEYNPQKDGMGTFDDPTFLGYDFLYQREQYWKRRAADAGVCSLLFCQDDAWKLTRYYDYHEQFEDGKWVWGDPSIIALDIVGIPLGFMGNGIKVAKETPYVLIGGASTLVTGINSGYAGDAFGMVLSGLGVIPVIGSFASAMSLGRDVGRFETFKYVPPVNR